MRGYICNFVACNYMAKSCNRNSQHGVSYLCLTYSGDKNNNVKSSKLHNYAVSRHSMNTHITLAMKYDYYYYII